MIYNKPSEQSNNVADTVAQSAENAIRSTQHVANNALDDLSGAVQGIRQQAAPLLSRATEQASALAQRGVDAVRDRSQHLSDRAHQASDATIDYIKAEPVKAMLIAAATGAALMALLSMSRSRGHG